MTVSIADLIKNTRQFEFVVPNVGSSLSVVYKPGEVTQNMLRATDSGDSVDAMIKQLCAVIKEWDLLDEKGAAKPVTPEALAELPTWFLREVEKNIIRDIRAMTSEEKKS